MSSECNVATSSAWDEHCDDVCDLNKSVSSVKHGWEALWVHTKLRLNTLLAPPHCPHERSPAGEARTIKT